MTAPSFPQGLSGLERLATRASFAAGTRGRTLSGATSYGFPICPGAQGFAGEVDLITTPIGDRVVRLYERSSGRLVRQTVSDSAGQYAFPGVSNLRNYYLVALDLQPGGFNAAIADYVVPT